ncbi:MAG: hypothetical protein F7C32_02730 [Desulfurococcales archaeon]|nr:hypothetical protein [Desulfurococcales archaeon]
MKELLMLTLAVLLLIASTASLHIQASSNDNGVPVSNYVNVYPCKTCHANFQPSATTNVSVYHGINLTVGPHRGLQCINCHNPESGMMKLQNGVEIAFYGLHNNSMVMKINSLCGSCHEKEYESYLKGAHGNETFTCAGGMVEEVIGYNGVTYYQHYCPEDHGYTPEPAKPCIACHNPHNPTMYPPTTLPPPSERPPPPNEDYILIGGVSVLTAGFALIAGAAILNKRGR